MLALTVITVVSLGLTAIMAVVTWRILREERRRAAARVDTLSRELELDATVAERFPVGDEFLVAPGDGEGGRRVVTSIVAGALFVGAAVVLAVTLSSASRGTSKATTLAASPGSETPLELVALTHERDGDRLTVRGTIRSPKGAETIDRLTASVFVFGRDGGFVASGRADVAATPLAPGGESAFLVVLPDVADVARYRVSFRSDDRVVPHVDRRETAPGDRP